MSIRAPWGGEKKVYVSYPELFQEIYKDSEIKYELKDLLHIAVGVGLNSGKERQQQTHKKEIINVYSIENDGVIETLLEILHPDKSGEELLQIFQEYADLGIQIIHEEYKKLGYFDVETYFKEDVSFD